MYKKFADIVSVVMIFAAVAVGIMGLGMDSIPLLLLSGGMFVGSFVLVGAVSDNPVE